MDITTMLTSGNESTRGDLITALEEYRDHPFHTSEIDTIARFLAFVRDNPACYSREMAEGHLTASAWVLRHDRRAVLLLHHRKLQRWLQPGGHADGDPNLKAVARKEVEEETGLTDLKCPLDGIFDIDIHRIPPRGEIPSHLHYDVRYLFLAPADCEPRGNDESTEVQWVALEDLKRYTEEESVLRMASKGVRLEKLRSYSW